jgi:sugar/nucleoside kinase (ribokinase family)
MNETIVAIGDVFLQLISSQLQEAEYQCTVIADAADAEYGGSAWNVVWYLDQLGWTARMLAQYGPDAVGCFPPLPVSRRDALEPLWLKQRRTDQLLVFPNIKMPSIYLIGRLSPKELSSLSINASGNAAIIFAGSRHPELRHRTIDVLRSERGPLRVFSPSYSVYEYRSEELAAFLANADIAIVNRREAAFLANVFATDQTTVMSRAGLAGIITRDEDGATVYPTGGLPFEMASTSGVGGDAIGAGDAFLSGFIDGFLRSGDITTAARIGIEVSAQTARSGLVCAHLDLTRVGGVAAP